MSVMNLNSESSRVPDEQGREAANLIKPFLKTVCAQREVWCQQECLKLFLYEIATRFQIVVSYN